MERVTLPQRLRAIASDVEHGAQETSAEMLRWVAQALEQETDALEELAAAATRWRDSRGGSREEFQAKVDMVAALDRAEDARSRR